MGDLVEQLSALSPERLALLKSRLQRGNVGARLPIPRLPSDRHAFPLSFAQERLWFLDQLHRGSPMYNIAMAYRFAGPINVAALAQSFDEIVRRHDVLRTTVAFVD